MNSTASEKYREAQAWVDESRRLMDEATATFRADPTPDNRFALEQAQSAWRRDLDIRMKRADQMEGQS